MIYSVRDIRYLELAYRNSMWNGPDLSKLDPPIAKILKQWEDEMLAIEIRWSDAQLMEAQLRVSMDFVLHTCLRFMAVTGEEEAVVEAQEE